MVKNDNSEIFSNIYQILNNRYGAQGWWPLIDLENKYHIGDYSFPKNESQIFEICIGAILTQNTTWKSVERSLKNLREFETITPQLIIKLSDKDLKDTIKPSGYFNQKTIYIRAFTKFFLSLKGNVPTRNELLKIKGIGNETADSILLYAYKQPEFIIDAYTIRIFSNLGLIGEKSKYNEIKKMFQEELTEKHRDFDLIITYQEYHALIVEHAKRYYSKKPYDNCPIKKILKTKD